MKGHISKSTVVLLAVIAMLAGALVVTISDPIDSAFSRTPLTRPPRPGPLVTISPRS